MRPTVAFILAGLMLAFMTGPSSAQRVTYKVDLYYEEIVDGPRPVKVVRLTVPAASAQAAESLCATSLAGMSTYLLHRNPFALGLTSNWLPGGGRCVRDKEGNIEMTVQASGGNN